MNNQEKTCIYSEFLSAATTFKASLSLTFDNENLSYEELTKKVDIYSGYLAAAGVSSGIAVGVLLTKTTDYVALYLAICKLNAVPPTKRKESKMGLFITIKRLFFNNSLIVL